MSVRMTSAGDYGWVSDRAGYRYEARHPDGMVPWPDPAPRAGNLEGGFGDGRAPQCCLVNFYDADAKMGLHQDRDEADFTMPVVSMSLGDDALFRVGGIARGGKTQSVWLKSGDVAVCRVRRGLPITVSIASARAVPRFCPGADGST
jgi:alkylated DNA repair protein (DNA oxidative demethylase)